MKEAVLNPEPADSIRIFNIIVVELIPRTETSSA